MTRTPTDDPDDGRGTTRPASERRAGGWEPDREVSPQEAFSILGNGTRMSILHELWNASTSTVSFSELRERVGHEDRGNFRYHLNELVGHFVKRTDDGYAIESAGEAVVRAVLKGSITRDLTFGPVELEERCPLCGATVELEYDDMLNAHCTECPGIVGGDFPRGTYTHYEFPPAGVQDRSPEEVLSAAHTFYDSKITPMFEGVCPECAGGTNVTLDVCPDHDGSRGRLCPTCETTSEVWATFECTLCGYTRQSLAWFTIMNRPEVISFYQECGGIDETVPFRKFVEENARYIRGIDQTVVSTDPLLVRISIEYGGERLDVTVDGELDVVDVERI